jgi:hypothetical protein
MDFNVNQPVRVKLTEFGKKTYAEHFTNDTGMKWNHDNVVGKDGRIELPLWELMQVFGKTMYHGMTELPFETKIEFIDVEPQNDETPSIRR